MIKFMVGNQKGGVAKTTSALTLSRCLADRGYRTLLVDSDPQGSVTVSLRLRPELFLSNFVMEKLRLSDCVTQVADNLDVLCGNRDTVTMEARIFTEYGRENVFANAFRPFEHSYDAIIVDVAPSISLLQACAMVMCRKILIPVSMDVLSVSGAGATLTSAKTLSDALQVPIEPLALLPTIVHKRYAMTDTVIQLIHQISKENGGIPVLESIRTDQSISKAALGNTRCWLILTPILRHWRITKPPPLPCLNTSDCPSATRAEQRQSLSMSKAPPSKKKFSRVVGA